jgi:toxin YhaV
MVGGWQLYAHPLFLDQIAKLNAAIDKARKKSPETYQNTAASKTLDSIVKLVNEVIPSDPTRPEFRQGDTLGPDHKHWFRAKFGGGRFRLFFRYDSKQKVIVYAWVNDENTLRAYESKTDAYAVFRKMLDQGNPPTDWDDLMKACGPTNAGQKF